MENLEPNWGKTTTYPCRIFTQSTKRANSYKVTPLLQSNSYTSNTPWTHTVLVSLDLNKIHSLKRDEKINLTTILLTQANVRYN